ncbi:MAG: response regulator [Deltaproteobacteria bacterium]|nr:response regulator [Deltaproteobacteria bacterium]
MKYDPAIHDAPTQPLPPKDSRASREVSSTQARDVVVVDHDPEVQTRVARTLTERGSRVVATSSPDAALTLMSQWNAGLVLVSEALPGQSGLELARKIREDHPAAQVVLMATNESAELRASAMIVGAIGLLVKPFNLQALFDLLDLSALSPAE